MAKKTTSNRASLPGFSELKSLAAHTYSGEHTNTHLIDFVRIHLASSNYDHDDDTYSTTPTLGSITASKRTPLYGLHSYDSKKPHTAVEQYIEHFTNVGDLVLDPFVGSGTTAIAALLRGRKCMALDASPLATFVTANSCTPASSHEILSGAKRVVASAKKATNDLYSTRCGHCGGAATVMATVYSQTYQCKRCVQRVALYDAIKASSESDDDDDDDFKALCPHCLRNGYSEPLSTRQARLGYIAVRLEYECEVCDAVHVREHDDTNPKELKQFTADLAVIASLDNKPPLNWYPTRRMLWNEEEEGRWGVLWRPYHGEIRRVDQFFTDRNLHALSAMLAAIKTEEGATRSVLQFLFSAFLLSQSKLQRYHPGSTFPNMIAPGLLYVAPMVKEYNSFNWFIGKVKGALKAFDVLSGIDPGDLIVSTQSAISLSGIPDNSVDYVFTDPPYSGRIQYGELNFIQEAWLGFEKNWSKEEIIVSTHRGFDETTWADMLRKAVQELYRVLKPGRWMSLCFHDSSEGVWGRIQDILREAGFVAESGDEAVFIDAKQKSLKQITSDKITKRDLIINVRKPRAGEALSLAAAIPAGADAKTFADLGRAIIWEFLTAHPGAQKDRVYDHLVNRMVKQGDMEAHDFDSLLRTVAEEVSEPVKKNLFENRDADVFGSHLVSRWYLRDTADQIDTAEQDKEDAAAARLERYMKKYFAKVPEADGVHYSDLFEQVISIPVEDRPRRLFENWLSEYFFKTHDGTWRPPSDDAERQQMADIREAGTLRRMKRFANALLEGVPVRDQDRPDSARTLAEWIRQCRRAGLYEQGRTMYEKGGLDLNRLDEGEQIEVEDDYRLCVKRGSEEGTTKKPKGAKKKKQ